MVSERELIGLLYRADWTQLSLSGTVTGAGFLGDTVIHVQSGEPLSPPWRRDEHKPPPPPPPWSSAPRGQRLFERMAEAAYGPRLRRMSESYWTFEPGRDDGACALTIAPGRRFRAEDADGSWAIGCDGTRVWQWLRDRPPGVSIEFDGRPRPPYRTLLVPSWLLTDYSLVLDGEVTVCGRTGVRVLGTPRQVAERTVRFGGSASGRLLGPIPRWMNPAHWTEVDAVVDAELGILLYCSQRSGDEPPAVTEFSSLDVGEPAHASRFSAPAGSVLGDDKGSRTRGPGDPAAGTSAGASLGDALGEALGAVGKEAAQTVAGMAAGGLGALIRYAPVRVDLDPFAKAAAEAADRELEMPADEPAPDSSGSSTAPALTDEVLHLIYRSGLAAPRLRATLHQWSDFGAVLETVPSSTRGKGFGGVGFFVDAVRDVTRKATAGAGHAISNVTVGGWSEFRIDVVRSAADTSLVPGNAREFWVAVTIASDGERQWQVFRDRVVTGPASPPPAELTDLVDASWLLSDDLELSGGEEVEVGGRRAYRIVARYREDSLFNLDFWQRLFFPAVAVVDAEAGLVLRLTRFKGQQATRRQELRDVSELGADADFGFTPPAGLPVQEADSPPDAGSARDDDRPGFRFWSGEPPR
jgi:hypothetical protein